MSGSDAKRHPGVFVHESAYVDEPCEIGEGTKIWHFAHVMKESRIGRHCNLGQNVVVSPQVVVGDHCKIQNNVSLYEGVTLEDGVFCGPSIVFTNVINPRSEISRKGEYRPTVVRRGATLGANATILCGIEIGRYAFVGAGAVVTHDVGAYGLVMGAPARRTAWICRCGIRLPKRPAGSQLDCEVCGNSYREEDRGLQPLKEVQE